MSDVEGVRTLIARTRGILGGLLTAAIALYMLLRISPVMTGLAAALLLVHGWTAEGVQCFAPDLSERDENQCRGQRTAYGIALRCARREGVSR